MKFKMELAKLINKLLGCNLLAKHICSDNPGFGKFLQKLWPGWPVLLVCRDGHLALMLPSEDYKALETGEADVEAYVSAVRWSYGYYWGSDHTLIGGVYWRVPERTSGINDTARISRYLQILRCRADNEALGLDLPTAERCAACSVDGKTCPNSPCQIENLKDEVHEPDARGKIFLEIRKRLSERGLYVRILDVHNAKNADLQEATQQIRLIPLDIEHKLVEARISQTVMTDLLYNGSTENWRDKAAGLTEIVAQRDRYSDDSIMLDPDSEKSLSEQCLEFWNTEPSKPAVASAPSYKGRRHFPRRTGGSKLSFPLR